MKKSLGVAVLLVVALLVSSERGFPITVMPDAQLDGIHGQTSIYFSAFLTGLVGDDYSRLTPEEKNAVRQEISGFFGHLSEDEIDRIIDTQQMMAEKILQLPTEQQEQINNARRILTEDLQTSSEAELLKMINSPGVAADNLAEFALDKLNQILIAQQIITSMIRTLSPHEQNQMNAVQQIVDLHFDSLRR